MTVALAHREDGNPDGPAVFLSPSLGTTWAMWDELTAALADRFRVVRYDTRGHGGSPVPPGPYAVADLAADVLALADTLGVERFAFVGLSLGGAIGQALALAHPERLSALVLCSTAPRFGDPAIWAERAAQVRAEGMAPLAEPTKGRWFTDEFAAAHPGQVDRFIGMITATPPEGYAACCDALRGFDVTADLGRIAVPTRVVGADQDPVCPPSVTEPLAAAIPGADLVMLTGASHMASAAQPHAFHAAVLEHLEKHA
ncbi:MAG: 3-oxoadipate enol-lactonase [Nocardioidaceae bacterium]